MRIGAYECVSCHVRSYGWTYTQFCDGDVWARCPRCGAEQVVGEVK